MASKPTSTMKTSRVTKVTGPASYFPSIEKNYGRPIAEWKKLIRSRYPGKHVEIVKWLKDEHGMGHGHANALVGHTLGEDATQASPAASAQISLQVDMTEPNCCGVQLAE